MPNTDRDADEAKRSPRRVKRPHLRDIRTRNRALLLSQLLKRGAASRHDLSLQTGLTHASVSRITKELIAEGICCEGQSYRTDNRFGRRRVELRIDPKGGYVIAICLSAFSRLVAITDIAGQRHHEIKIPEGSARSAEAAIDFIGRYIDRLTEKGLLRRDRLLGAALAIAGSVDPGTGHLTRAPLLKWQDFPVREQLAERLACPVRVENVADTLCLTCLDRANAENASYLHIFLVHVAVGMGASLAIDRRIVRRRGDEAWIGNMPVPAPYDQTGKITRLDQVSSGHAILQRLEGTGGESGHDSVTVTARLEAAVQAANRRVGREQEVFFKAGQALGASLLPLTAAYLPDIIVLAGPAVAANPFGKGAISSYQQVARGSDAASVEFLINRTSYIEAAENLALREHFCSGVSPSFFGAAPTS